MGDGKFKAINKDRFEGLFEDVNIDLIENLKDIPVGETETFDISGTIDKTHGTYKTYEKNLQKFLKKEYPEMKRITDEQGVEWFEVPVKDDWAKQPIPAYGKTTVGALLSIATAILAGTYIYAKSKKKEALPIKYNMFPESKNKPGYTTLRGRGIKIGDNKDEINKVIATIFGESAGEKTEGTKAVINVIFNRILNDDKYKTMFDVVSKPKQFSAFNIKNKLYSKARDYLRGDKNKLNLLEKKKLNEIEKIIKEGLKEDITNGATHYLNIRDAEDLSWKDKLEFKKKIGKHSFYRED